MSIGVVCSPSLALETSLAALEISLAALETSLAALETSLAALETSLAAVETSLAALETSLKVRLHTAINQGDFVHYIRTKVTKCIREKLTLYFRG